MADLILNIDGMTCGGCVNSVQGVLNTMAGVSDAAVSLEAKQAQINYDPSIVSPEELAAAVADAGFEVSF
ncbi:heavy-metal-associated domain-containing protein [Chromobacterium amazonense]|uniref:Heavy metal-associated domain-containing protein n=1 Tax=Chromobacterium amazonense TaxID=1382803 RepID=A0A1S1X7D2_9NEIS|nr:heavy metal-associated domain-containing protein [Chromobacterium amazonense]KIA78927.1 hypothetical protein QR66_18805 [Chromobacterium piscinae]MBM2883100.1 heavy-metal-associated domain-containing protein [Chromobacterium amazonense]MDE1712839.1 heavy metal-associated domain-containing protein [Chromobacterium amazonense]MDQ4540610.1 heavy metal-associated domain-containing protein [Chromobacterium amazonense]OHX15378.1 hypothetical protein BI343_03275 [Chromobacterium amazonense]